jgi:hypothetical protein
MNRASVPLPLPKKHHARRPKGQETSLICLFCLSSSFRAAAVELPGAKSTGTQAVRAQEFLNSLGACSAISRRGESLTNTIGAARYLGLRWFCVGYESDIPISDLIELHRQNGVRFSYGSHQGARRHLTPPSAGR